MSNALGQKPPKGAPPAPGPDYLWIDGKWWQVATDTGDNVPRDLNLPPAGPSPPPDSEPKP